MKTFFDVFDKIVSYAKKCQKKFKVVFAGLNMIRDYEFINDKNFFGGQLDSNNYILIKPFNDEEAFELVEKPLRYLGLYFLPKFKSLICLIIDKANYYPCLIQLYCQGLLEVMCEKNYAYYEQPTSPVYYVNQRHIKEVLSDKEREKDIWEKFEATLKLNPTLSSTGTKGDDIYNYLAYILAFLCFNRKEEYSSYKIEDFVDIAKKYKIEHICKLYAKKDENEKSKLELYMDHLVDLSVFSRIEEKEDNKIVKKYSFRRLQLYQLLINNVDIEKKIKNI